MATTLTLNEKAAADTNRDGLGFVWTTPLPPGKDSNDDPIQDFSAPFKPN